jgi:hypothetical protein
MSTALARKSDFRITRGVLVLVLALWYAVGKGYRPR